MSVRSSTTPSPGHDFWGRFYTLLQNFLLGDAIWANVRMASLFAVIALIAVALASLFETVTSVRIWHSILFPLMIIALVISWGSYILRDVYEVHDGYWRVLLSLVVLVTLIALLTWTEYKYVRGILRGPSLWRYLFVPLTALIYAMIAAGRYVQDIYGLDDFGFGLLYVLSSFWGIAYPRLIISEGRKDIAADKKNRLDLIGGAGYVTVRPGNLVLMERLQGPSGVYASGTFFASRFEAIAAVVSLDDQHGVIPSVTATTKDGLTVVVRDVQFRYRVWSGRWVTTAAGRSLMEPYPYTVQAIRNMAYNRSVSKDGLTTWHDAVKGVITGAIAAYIMSHQLDQITAPRYGEGDPRKEISARLKAPPVRDALKEIGAQLLWCDIGHFSVEEEGVLKQRVETWKAGWMGSASVKRAYGEARRVAYQEIGRAEAQAEILMSIIHALDDIDLSKEQADRNIRNLILMRTAQVLEAMASPLGNQPSPGGGSAKDARKGSGP